ncbi:TELT protein, partial [Uria aalge]|nr:TELT protein [Uria aalge]
WSPWGAVGHWGVPSGARGVGVSPVGQSRTWGSPHTPPAAAPPHERPVPRWCRREVDEEHRETLEHRGETRVLQQRSPWGLLRVGCLGQPLAQHLLPYARTLPLPLFAPPDLRGAKAGVPRTLSRSLSHEAQRG